jgi:hypothetical protein
MAISVYRNYILQLGRNILTSIAKLVEGIAFSDSSEQYNEDTEDLRSPV